MSLGGSLTASHSDQTLRYVMLAKQREEVPRYVDLVLDARGGGIATLGARGGQLFLLSLSFKNRDQTAITAGYDYAKTS